MTPHTIVEISMPMRPPLKVKMSREALPPFSPMAVNAAAIDIVRRHLPDAFALSVSYASRATTCIDDSWMERLFRELNDPFNETTEKEIAEISDRLLTGIEFVSTAIDESQFHQFIGRPISPASVADINFVFIQEDRKREALGEPTFMRLLRHCAGLDPCGFLQAVTINNRAAP